MTSGGLCTRPSSTSRLCGRVMVALPRRCSFITTRGSTSCRTTGSTKIDAVTEGVLTFASHRVGWFQDGVLVYQTTIGALLQQSLSHREIAGKRE